MAKPLISQRLCTSLLPLSFTAPRAVARPCGSVRLMPPNLTILLRLSALLAEAPPPIRMTDTRTQPTKPTRASSVMRLPLPRYPRSWAEDEVTHRHCPETRGLQKGIDLLNHSRDLLDLPCSFSVVVRLFTAE